MTTCKLRIHGLLLFLDLQQHKHPCLWLWDHTQRFQITLSNDLDVATIFYQCLIVVLAPVDSWCSNYIPWIISNLNIRDSLEFLHRNSIKNGIHDFAIKSAYFFFFRSLPLAYRSSQLLSSIFYKIPNSLINRFQECFYPYFPVSIIVLIKVRWDHKRVTMFYDNLLWYHFVRF